MTPREVSFATGVNIATVYQHLHRGALDGRWNGSRWTIPAWACVSWADWLWREGRVLQFPPPYAQRFIEHFHLA